MRKFSSIPEPIRSVLQQPPYEFYGVNEAGIQVLSGACWDRDHALGYMRSAVKLQFATQLTLTDTRSGETEYYTNHRQYFGALQRIEQPPPQRLVPLTHDIDQDAILELREDERDFPHDIVRDANDRQWIEFLEGDHGEYPPCDGCGKLARAGWRRLTKPNYRHYECVKVAWRD